MITESRREQIRRAHRAVAPEGRCAIQREPFPCTAIEFLNELEQLESETCAVIERLHHESGRQITALQARVEELEATIRRAVGELTS